MNYTKREISKLALENKCGCILNNLCPMHNAASDMYEALKEVFQLPYPGEHRNDCYGEVKPSPDCQTCKIIKVRKHVIKALAKAEGK